MDWTNEDWKDAWLEQEGERKDRVVLDTGTFVRCFLRGQFGAQLSAEDVEDVTQETLTPVHENVLDYDPARAKWQTWVACIARNNAIELLRRMRLRRAERIDLHQAMLAARDDLAAEVQANEQHARTSQVLSGYLRELEGFDRQILELRWYEGISFEEIGRILGASKDTVRRRWYRMLSILRSRLRRLDADKGDES